MSALGGIMKLTILIILFSLSTKNSVAGPILKDVGIIGLLSHDLFAWDRKNEVNKENGRLDLSTIFDYEDGKRWMKGGDPKNSENSPVWSVTKRIIDFHKTQLKEHNPTTARKLTVKFFHQMIRDSFHRISGMDFPTEAIEEKVNNTEQAALRAMHDILPGRVKFFRGPYFPLKDFSLTNFLFLRLYLNDKELDQKLKSFDGDYDQEYKEIKIPFTNTVINLMEVDRKFIEKFSPYKQSNMLRELKRVGENEITISEIYFIDHIINLFQKGFCSKGNEWMPNELPCY